jgi:hypothetical protein
MHPETLPLAEKLNQLCCTNMIDQLVQKVEWHFGQNHSHLPKDNESVAW